MYQRWILSAVVRAIVLSFCMHEVRTTLDLHVAVIMPDRVHMIFTPLIDHEALEVYSLARITN